MTSILRALLKMHFFRGSGVSFVLESSCMPYTLRFCVRRFLVLTKKLLFFRGSLKLKKSVGSGKPAQAFDSPTVRGNSEVSFSL